MDKFTYIVENVPRKLPIALIPKHSMLYTMQMSNVGKNAEKRLSISNEEFSVIKHYLRTGFIDAAHKHLLQFFMLTKSEYDLERVQENFVRAKMYSAEISDDVALIRTKKHYALEPIMAPIAAPVRLNAPHLFEPNLKPRDFRDTMRILSRVDWIINEMALIARRTSTGAIVAGGYVFTALFDYKEAHNTDIDIFVYGDATDAEIIQFIKNISRELETRTKPSAKLYRDRDFIEVLRSANCVTLTDHFGIKYQIMTRVYTMPHEVIHGFDVDCTCVMYDGKTIWATARALYAFKIGANTFSFDLLSPSYEHRLAKYAARGIGLIVEGFDESHVNKAALNNARTIDYNKNLIPHPHYKYGIKSRIGHFRGIDVLLCYKYTKYYHQLFNTDVSDYSPNDHSIVSGVSILGAYNSEIATDDMLAIIGVARSNRSNVHMFRHNISSSHEHNLRQLREDKNIIKSTDTDSDSDSSFDSDSESDDEIDQLYEEDPPYDDKVAMREYMREYHEQTQLIKKRKIEEIDEYFDNIHTHKIAKLNLTDATPSIPIEYIEYGTRAHLDQYNIIDKERFISGSHLIFSSFKKFDRAYVDEQFKRPDIALIKVNCQDKDIFDDNLMWPIRWIHGISTYIDDVLGGVGAEILNKFNATQKYVFVELPPIIVFNRYRPGDQATSTYHRIVLDDHNEWFKGNFYG